jgi:hypothetical protein
MTNIQQPDQPALVFLYTFEEIRQFALFELDIPWDFDLDILFEAETGKINKFFYSEDALSYGGPSKYIKKDREGCLEVVRDCVAGFDGFDSGGNIFNYRYTTDSKGTLLEFVYDEFCEGDPVVLTDVKVTELLTTQYIWGRQEFNNTDLELPEERKSLLNKELSRIMTRLPDLYL